MKYTIIILYSLAVAVLMPITVDMAYKERGYFAIGGEYGPGFTIPIAVSLLREEKET